MASPPGRGNEGDTEGTEFFFGVLVVWNMAFIFPYIANDIPNWPSQFLEGLKPPTNW